MKKLNFIFLSVLILAGCTNTGTTDNPDKKGAARTDIAGPAVADADTRLIPGFFNAIPDTIDGCGEYFTFDTCRLADNRYIFLSNISEFAIIRIEGKDIYLNKDTVESRDMPDKSYIAIYEGHGYKAVLNVILTKKYDEGGFYLGALQITGDKIKATFKVHGTSGC